MNLTDYKTIKEVLERHGFTFSKAMGQNFLINPRIPERIAEEAGLEEGCTVLEIGPGIGCLTKELSKRAGRVVSVELDTRLIPVLRETLSDCDNVEIRQGDILTVDLSDLKDEPIFVCANLPYNITTPILTHLFTSGLRLKQVTVMVQKEVAQRFSAHPGSKDYGAITLFLNYYSQPKTLFQVSAGNFMPQPKVDSAVISLTATPPPVSTPAECLLPFIRAAFEMRRKTLPNALQSYGKEAVASALTDIGKQETARAETLSLQEFDELYRRVCR